MSEIRVKQIKPLPEPLPAGERVLWQGAPAWRPYSRRVFHVRKVALYFTIIIAWVAGSAAVDGGASAAGQAMIWSLPPALGVLGMLVLCAWLYARSSVYTITNKRVVLEAGVALPSSANLPFSKFEQADLKSFADGTGDIELNLTGPRLLYSMLWPNVRWFRVNRTTPVLWAIEDPQNAASILSDALKSEQQADSEPATKSSASEPEMRRSVAS